METYHKSAQGTFYFKRKGNRFISTSIDLELDMNIEQINTPKDEVYYLDLLEELKCKEITKKEWDDHFITVASKINELV